MRKYNNYKDILLRKRSFFSGMGTIFSLFGTSSQSFSIDPEKTDSEAILSDWNAVGDDLRKIIPF